MAISKSYTDMNKSEWDALPILAKRIRLLLERDGITLNQLGKKCGISSSVMKSYIEKQVDIGISALQKLADAFNVSTDCLLGRVSLDNSTPDKKLRAVSEYTGLGNTAVEKLRKMKAREPARAWTNTLSLILSDPQFEYLLGVLEGYFAEEMPVYKNLAMSGVTVNQKDISIFAASNILRNMMERVGEQFFQQGYRTSQERTELATKIQMAELEE